MTDPRELIRELAEALRDTAAGVTRNWTENRDRAAAALRRAEAWLGDTGGTSGATAGAAPGDAPCRYCGTSPHLATCRRWAAPASEPVGDSTPALLRDDCSLGLDTLPGAIDEVRTYCHERDAELARLRADAAVAHLTTYGNAGDAMDEVGVPRTNDQGQVMGLESRVRYLASERDRLAAELAEARDYIARVGAVERDMMRVRADQLQAEQERDAAQAALAQCKTEMAERDCAVVEAMQERAAAYAERNEARECQELAEAALAQAQRELRDNTASIVVAAARGEALRWAARQVRDAYADCCAISVCRGGLCDLADRVERGPRPAERGEDK